MQSKSGFGAIIVVGIVAVSLLAVVGFGYYANKVKQNNTLGYKTTVVTKAPLKAKASSKLGLSAGDSVANIDADFNTLNFEGIESSFNEVSLSISGK